jgi:NADPH2:quinone reductase
MTQPASSPSSTASSTASSAGSSAASSGRTIRSVVYRRNGGPEVLELVDAAVREPGPGEALLRVHRAGVNPTDWKARQGAGDGRPVDPPQSPGQDGAGVVEEVGNGVSPAWVGVRAWIWEAAYQRPDGTAQERAIVPASHLALLPDTASFDLGASLGVPFITAHRCLTVAEHGPRRLGPGTLDGRTVLVAGGAGAVGNAVIQLGRWSDATVIATVSSPRKAQLAAAAGADHVIDYTRQDVAAEVRKIAPHGVDLISEVSASRNAGIDAAVLGANGVVAVYADNGGAEMTLPIRSFMMVNARWQFVLLYTVPDEAKRWAVEDVGAAVLDGAVRVGEQAGLPLHHYSLERTAEAHAAVQDGAVGKVLIDVQP